MGGKKQIVIGNLLNINDEFNSSFVILKNGDVIENFKNNKFIKIGDYDSLSISIALENQGFLSNHKNEYINYIGTIYKGKVIKKKWRGREFWEPYTKKQINNLIKLCKKICVENKIPPYVVSNNTYIVNINEFEGIAFRSNYSKFYYDVSPAFDIESFKQKIEN
jgi:hypothetical protein